VTVSAIVLGIKPNVYIAFVQMRLFLTVVGMLDKAKLQCQVGAVKVKELTRVSLLVHESSHKC